LASLDGLLLVQSRIAMNDIHVTFFIIMTFWAYWRFRHTPTLNWATITGLLAGLAMGSKWSGVFPLGLIWILEVSELVLRKNWSRFTTSIFVLGFLPIAVYVASYAMMFYQGKSLFCWEQRAIPNTCYFERFTTKEGFTWFEGYISHFAELHRQTWWYQTHLTATHSYQSRPWQWWLNLRPVWIWVGYDQYKEGQIENIYTFGNPVLFWLADIAIVWSLFAMAILGVKKIQLYSLQSYSKESKLLRQEIKKFRTVFGLTESLAPFLYLFAAYWIVWLPWQLSPRIMFVYHNAPAVLMKTNRYIIGTAVVLITICFAIWYPHLTGMTVPTDWANAVYFVFPAWK
jgi:dolichyl-phosphate-mannose-protein mannosyltransferase